MYKLISVYGRKTILPSSFLAL